MRDGRAARRVRHVVEIALGIRGLEVDRRREKPVAHPEDGRRLIVELSPAGIDYTRELLPKAETVTKVTLAPLATNQRATLIALLKQLR